MSYSTVFSYGENVKAEKNQRLKTQFKNLGREDRNKPNII